ncbi:hypothetical protein DFH07DRAFT_739468 [Mycena maculata]|uniref:Uncharacterized protein n=1 Tax=Mycena maculata TaxID=230809 RepID=A0AAD7JDZ2_9AGAR|nr:hypothetical protein DFH07DRAFT_739468 [Mycena maculata]
MPKTRPERTRPALEGKTVVAVKKDILISIKQPHMNNIVSRAKNHEFRKYLIARTVERMWLYVSNPDQTLRYIAVISQGKVPGEIENEEGIGNADFNKAARGGLGVASHAYEILHLYKLRLPLKINVLTERYGISPPQRYAYAPKQLLDDIPLEEQEMLF